VFAAHPGGYPGGVFDIRRLDGVHRLGPDREAYQRTVCVGASQGGGGYLAIPRAFQINKEAMS